MSNGKILPYSVEDAEVFGDERGKDIICQLDISLYDSGKQIEEENEYDTTNYDLTISVTKECTETIAQLEKAGAVKKKPGV